MNWVFVLEVTSCPVSVSRLGWAGSYPGDSEEVEVAAGWLRGGGGGSQRLGEGLGG